MTMSMFTGFQDMNEFQAMRKRAKRPGKYLADFNNAHMWSAIRGYELRKVRESWEDPTLDFKSTLELITGLTSTILHIVLSAIPLGRRCVMAEVTPDTRG